MFIVVFRNPADGERDEVKVYYHRSVNLLKMVFSNRCEYNIETAYHPDKRLRMHHAKEAVRSHFAISDIEILGI